MVGSSRLFAQNLLHSIGGHEFFVASSGAVEGKVGRIPGRISGRIYGERLPHAHVHAEDAPNHQTAISKQTCGSPRGETPASPTREGKPPAHARQQPNNSLFQDSLDEDSQRFRRRTSRQHGPCPPGADQERTHLENTRFLEPDAFPPSSSSPRSQFFIGVVRFLSASESFGRPAWTSDHMLSRPASRDPPPPLALLAFLLLTEQDALRSSHSFESCWLRRSSVAISASMLDPPFSVPGETKRGHVVRSCRNVASECRIGMSQANRVRGFDTRCFRQRPSWIKLELLAPRAVCMPHTCSEGLGWS